MKDYKYFETKYGVTDCVTVRRIDHMYRQHLRDELKKMLYKTIPYLPDDLKNEVVELLENTPGYKRY